MTTKKENLRKNLCTQVIVNVLASTMLYAMLMFIMHYAGIEIVWDITMYLSIVASVAGVAHILTIRNPLNYLGFIPGLVMTVFLALQFYTLESYDLVVLYVCVFIPMQTKSFIEWNKSLQNYELGLGGQDDFRPKFQAPKQLCVSILVFLLIVAADFALLKWGLESKLSVYALISSAVMVSSSILANYLMISKKIDTWIYWLLYSVAGLVLAFLIDNTFNIVLFLFFLVINSYTAAVWIRKRSKGDF